SLEKVALGNDSPYLIVEGNDFGKVESIADARHDGCPDFASSGVDRQDRKSPERRGSEKPEEPKGCRPHEERLASHDGFTVDQVASDSSPGMLRAVKKLAKGLVRGDDGNPRCFWAMSDPMYVAYHDV